ncbi:MAG TPA: tetratricopeptide repeat protein [Candidatus Marinimicrobia bacterium]|nr:tetratricopeptide repeat protein [Candidatus Neomarinimicrobiota bacterium]
MLKGQKKITRKEMKKDPFFERIDQSVRFYNENQQKIYIVLAVLMVLILAGWGVSQYWSSKAKSASSMLGIAQQYYFARDYDSARSKFSELRALYGKSEYAGYALYYSAMIEYNEGKYEQARKLLNEYLADFGSDIEFISAASATLGAIAAQAKEYGPAAAHYQKGAEKTANLTNKKDFYQRAFSYYLKSSQLKKAEMILAAVEKLKFADDKSKQELINSMQSMLTLAEK